MIDRASAIVAASEDLMCNAEVIGAWLSSFGGLEDERTALFLTALNSDRPATCIRAVRKLAEVFTADHAGRIEARAREIRFGRAA